MLILDKKFNAKEAGIVMSIFEHHLPSPHKI
jgi:hypothetical protein